MHILLTTFGGGNQINFVQCSSRSSETNPNFHNIRSTSFGDHQSNKIANRRPTDGRPTFAYNTTKTKTVQPTSLTMIALCSRLLHKYVICLVDSKGVTSATYFQKKILYKIQSTESSTTLFSKMMQSRHSRLRCPLCRCTVQCIDGRSKRPGFSSQNLNVKAKSKTAISV